MNAAQLTNEEEQAVSQIREEAAQKREHQNRVTQLERAVDQATERLSRATDFKSFAARRITDLQALQLQLAGQERTVANVDPTSNLLDSFQTIITLRAFLADWPRIAKHLESEVATATQRLTQFRKQQ